MSASYNLERSVSGDVVSSVTEPYADEIASLTDANARSSELRASESHAKVNFHVTLSSTSDDALRALFSPARDDRVTRSLPTNDSAFYSPSLRDIKRDSEQIIRYSYAEPRYIYFRAYFSRGAPNSN